MTYPIICRYCLKRMTQVEQMLTGVDTRAESILREHIHLSCLQEMLLELVAQDEVIFIEVEGQKFAIIREMPDDPDYESENKS